MKKLKLLKIVIKRTGADKMLSGFVIFTLLVAFIISLIEPNINSWWDGIWYCYSVISTVGFGDMLVVSVISKILSILLTIYSVIVIAIITGVIVNFYNESRKAQMNESLAIFLDKLEHLPDLSKDELKEISQKIKKIR